ncbi:hypothetical protein ACOMHN_058281 [Nucella lapillus]
MERESEGGQFRIDKELGRGSFGSVYCLTCSHSLHGPQTKFALKVIEGHGVGEREKEATHKELRIMRGLYHPAIVTLVDSFQIHHRLLLVLELCEGGDLRNHLDSLKKRRLTARMGAEESLVVHWTMQLTEGLQYLHHKKILHRDLKPQNIFLKDKFCIKIGDLGIARQLVFTKEMAATHIGTPLYISPEIYQGNSYSYKTDIWSLGCCVYEMMALQYAFHASSRYELVGRVVNKQVLPLPEAYSSSLRRLVLDMLCKDPEGRPHATQLHLDTEQPQTLSAERRQKSNNTDLHRSSERPRDSKSLQGWRLRTAKALTQFLNEKQAIQCAQLNAALAQHLTIDSIKDITSPSGDASSKSAAARRHKLSRLSELSSQLSGSDEETVDGGEEETGSSLWTESSDMTLLAESTLGDSQSRAGSGKGRVVNKNRLLSGKPSAERLQQRRQDHQNRERNDDDTLGSENNDSPSSTVVPTRCLKIGKSSMVVRARPLPYPNIYKESADRMENSLEYENISDTDVSRNTAHSLVSQNSALEKKDASSTVNNSQSEQSDSRTSISNNTKGVDVAYANEVLQWTRARLLPPASPQDSLGYVSLDGSRHSPSEETESRDTGRSMKDSAARKKGGVRDLTAQIERHVKERMRGSEADMVTNGIVKETGARDAQAGEKGVRRKDTDSGTGARDREKETTAAALDPGSTSQVSVARDKGKKKKRNFLKERKSRDAQGKGSDGSKAADQAKGSDGSKAADQAKGSDGSKAADQATSDDTQVDQATVDLQMEHGVKLFTRAQCVSFMCLKDDDMDLSIGGESYT